MRIEQLYTGCLAEAAYYIESNGEAAIIDPLRESEPYINLAKESGAKIKYIFETHFHADFVSGHLELAKKTGATIVFGPSAETGYKIHVAKDYESFKLGDITIQVLHTPGHTLESTTYLLIDEAGNNQAIFSGDTLFIGDVGRPDLAVNCDLNEEDLAGILYESLRSKIMPLQDHLTVYPGHGAGSSCGKHLSKETTDTLGNQKKTNYALREDMTKEEFIKEVTKGILPPPQYFFKNAAMNKQGYEDFDKVLEGGMTALSAEEFDKKKKEGVFVLDTRHQNDFAKGFIPGSINIALDGMFAIWVGTLIKELKQPLLIIAPLGREEETVMRLARVGYDHVVGFLEGGFETWKKGGYTTDSITSISANQLEEIMAKEQVNLVDVRKPDEHLSEHVIGAISYPLDYINENLEELDKEKTYYMHCAGGYRSMVAVSMLRKEGYRNIIDVEGGFGNISQTSIPTSEYVCPSTL
ncbi:MBL fold metallo-hydrolase [Xanthovirga aplysinae]|uniref:MBL fold metallo-hydrolase n=1 Tax=Xanthovirga aplysinae TaxID=2529853 RepID=UPI0012BBDC13|nr:MBL fold metallo-hydrolase [Xanthovirga aplysinae]MTI32947.1 MBL fold metallo-hydrolase [Xanthovirga aplysinae]